MPRSRVHDGVVFRRKESRVWWIRYRDRNGVRLRESTLTEDWNEAQKRLRDRLQARDNNVLDVVKKGESLSFGQWADFFLETYSKPPMRAEKTHEINLRAVKHLKGAFASSSLVDLTADHVEIYLRDRLRQRVRFKSSLGYREKGVLQPATVHQEFRVLRRVLNVAVRKKLKKDQIDLPNAVVWIPDSKTPNGIAEVPLTLLAVDAFRDQLTIAGDGSFLFPSDLNPTGHQIALRTVWQKTLRRAKVPYFRIYDLRSTYATRLSAGGVADEWVTQLLRQGDSQVFKRYSQMKLQMKREALEKINRQANEMPLGSGTAMVQ